MSRQAVAASAFDALAGDAAPSRPLSCGAASDPPAIHGEILRLASQGHTDRRIAADLVLSEHEVRAAWVSIRNRLGAASRVQAIALACGGIGEVEDDEPLARLSKGLEGGRISRWVFLPRESEVLLDAAGERLFALPPTGGAAMPLARFLEQIWHPDRARFERYLRQAPDLRPLTPFDVRAGETGDYRSEVRSVNLAAAEVRAQAVLLASTLV